MAEATADRFVAVAREAIEATASFRVALSGGGTPKQRLPAAPRALAPRAVDWSRVEFFWGDERAVPPDHPESNFGVAYQMLIAHLPDVRPDRIHRMPAEAPDLDAAALSYESEIRLAFGARGDEPPAFDLIWLGMGPDGHTASLFPGHARPRRGRALGGRQLGAVPGCVAHDDDVPAAERRAAHVLFVVTGADKAKALRAIRAGDSGLPAAGVSGRGVLWIVDEAAAGEPAST